MLLQPGQCREASSHERKCCASAGLPGVVGYSDHLGGWSITWCAHQRAERALFAAEREPVLQTP